MAQTIAAPADRSCTVQVFEPSQRVDQAEREIERFDLQAGESVDYEFNSATAAFRVLPQEPLGSNEHDPRAAPPAPVPDPTPPQEGTQLPETADELAAGADRQQALEAQEADAEKRQVAEDDAHAARTRRDSTERDTSTKTSSKTKPGPKPSSRSK